VVGLVGVGFSSGALHAVGPVFAQAKGLGVALTSAFMAAIVAGGMVLQGPVGWVSDRFDRRQVIAAVTLLAALAAASSLALARPPAWWLFAQFFFVGGLSLPMYALCAAHANDFLRQDQMVGASSALLLAYGIGAALGPTAAALCLQALGAGGYPLFLAAVHAGIGAFALWRMTRRPVVPAEERGPHVAVATPSPVVTPIADALRDAAMAERAAGPAVATAPAAGAG
jgi:MFS family permease